MAALANVPQHFWIGQLMAYRFEKEWMRGYVLNQENNDWCEHLHILISEFLRLISFSTCLSMISHTEHTYARYPLTFNWYHLYVYLWLCNHYDDVIIGAMASQITSLTIVYSTVYSDADQRKHQSSASLAFVWWIHRWPVNSPHKWPVTRKMSPFDDVIMICVVSAFLFLVDQQKVFI